MCVCGSSIGSEEELLQGIAHEEEEHYGDWCGSMPRRRDCRIRMTTTTASIYEFSFAGPLLLIVEVNLM